MNAAGKPIRHRVVCLPGYDGKRLLGAPHTSSERAIMVAFNLEIEKLLTEHGGELVRYWGEGEDYPLRWFALETRAGRAEFMPGGNAVYVRFAEPDRAVRALGSLRVNPHSGKWNHHYSGTGFAEALDDFRRELSRVIAPVNNAGKDTP